MRSCAENDRGSNNVPKMEISKFYLGVVGELSICSEAHDVSRGGADRSENAGMSSDSPDENSGCRMSKVSSATYIG